MTHEQKPESAEFRTREGQVDEIHDATVKAVCRGRSDYTPEIYRTYLGMHILEAEARGAAEQRRKDAEGDDPKAWIVAQGFYVPFVTLDADLLRGKPHSVITPLYDRPANVAALEDRVKELEGELGALLDWADGQWCPHDNTHRGGSIWTICNDCGRKWADDVKPFDPDEDFEPSAIKQARAAIREGGEHG